jgi:arsenate reductase-like glutaredoxin family protein
MKSLFKRVAVGALAAAMLLSTGLTAMAYDWESDMEYVGLHIEADVTNEFGVKVGELYNEIIDGRLTGKTAIKLVDNSRLEWKFEAYEDVYPYAGYDCLYIDGEKQANITRYNGQTPQWASKRQDYSWDITAPYEIWERQMTKVDGTTWTWDFGNDKFGIDDSTVCKPSGRYVDVTVDWETIGTASYALDGTMIYNTDPNTMEYKKTSVLEADYAKFGEKAELDAWKALANNQKAFWNALSVKDEMTNEYVVTDEMIQELVPVFKKKLVTAAGERTRDVYAAYKANPEFPVWATAAAEDTIEVFNDAEISWTKPQYELEEPYRMFQYLVINGIVLDGTKDADGNVKECVGRYTGAVGNPVVEWEFYMYQAKQDAEGDRNDHEVLPGYHKDNRQVYEVVERKLVNGKKVIDKATGKYVTRVQTDVYGYGYFKSVEGGMEYRIAMEDGSNDLLVGMYNAFTGEVESVSDMSLEGVNHWYQK